MKPQTLPDQPIYYQHPDGSIGKIPDMTIVEAVSALKQMGLQIESTPCVDGLLQTRRIH